MRVGPSSIPPLAGPGPTPLAAMLSDRVGEETPDPAPATTGADPLSHALRMLDSLSVPAVETADDLRTAAEPPAQALSAPSAGASGGDGTATLDDVHAAPVPEDEAPGASRREAILDAASALFAERGYHGASLRDISRRVGISHPGMLHHFSSKESLLGAVIDRLEAHAKGLLDSVEALQSSPQSLVAALSGPWDPREHQMALLATLCAEVVNPDHPGRFRIARLRLVHEHVLEQVLTGLKANGRLVDGADPRFLARSLFSLLLSLTVRERTVRALQTTADADPIDDVRTFVRGVARD